MGWRNQESDMVVIGVMEGVDPSAVEKALRSGILYRHPKHTISTLLDICDNAPIHVLGVTNPLKDATNYHPTFIFVNIDNTYPLLQPGIDGSWMAQIILFDPPEPMRMQYLSLEPIALALGEAEGQLDDIPDGEDEDEANKRLQTIRLIEKLKLHTVRSHKPTPKELALPAIINQINCCHEIGELLRQNAALIGVRSRRALSVSERVVESATTIRDYVLWNVWDFTTVYLYPFALNAFLFGVIIYRILAELLLLLLDWRWRPSYSALKDVSATAQQIDIRLQQFCWWPYQYMILRARTDDWASRTTNHAEYIRFFNSIWLVANDIIVGAALGCYLISDAHAVAAFLDRVIVGFSIDGLHSTIRWLMGWPAGLKLNEELAGFLGDLFLWVLDHWAGVCVGVLRPHAPAVVAALGFASFLGASMPIALLSDLCSLLTVHIYCFYLASARIYNWQLTIIGSLFHLFRGKKRNVLRNRIDSCDYALDQLLLGTILFTLLFFLLPTILVFYLTFAAARMAIIGLKAEMDILLACLNHFPLFALMLRLKDSRRLPGGISFELLDYAPIPEAPMNGAASAPGVNGTTDHQPRDRTTTSSGQVSYIYLRSAPLSMRSMFNQYFHLASRLRQHYLSTSVVKSLMTGRFVPPIRRKGLYSLQYSMLPSRRKGVIDLWERLMEHGGGSTFSGVSRGGSEGKKIR